MAAYNSSANSNQDDFYATMINQSSNNIQSTTSKHINGRNNRTNFDDERDYTFVDYDPLQNVKQIEQILNYYRQDLKQESNTQLDCNRKLVTRLVDFIRPTYSSHKKKMNDLETLFEEIFDLQDIRFIEQKEKNEQLHNEVLHLKKLIITSPNADHRRNNTMTNLYRINSMVDYQQWMEMEEETKRLYNLVELQRDQINELVKLMSQEETSPLQASASKASISPFDEAPAGKQQSTASNANAESTLVARIRAFTDQQQDSGTDILQKSTNEYHSRGTSPIHSLTNFLTESLVDTVDNETQNEEPPTVTTRILPPLSRISSYNDIKKCPICNHEFRRTVEEYEIYNHVERCLLSASDNDRSAVTEPKQYQCPVCHQQFPGNNEEVYLEHLSDCYANADT